VTELETLESFGLKREVFGIQFAENEKGRVLSWTLPGEEAGTCESRISGSFKVE
jgi:hypothetical protein